MDKIGSMEQAVITFKEAIRNVENRLDSLAWKAEKLERGALNVVKDNPKITMVSVMELMQGIENARKEYSTLTDEIQTIQETEREISSSVNAEIYNVHRNFLALRQLAKQLK